MRKHVMIWIALPVLLAASVLCGLLVGSVPLSPAQFLGALQGTDSEAFVIFFELRLPRVLAAALAGIALAPAGLTLQYTMGNSIASPSVLGISSGAGLGTMLVLALLPSAWYLLPVSAFLFAMAAACFVSAVSFGREKNTVILCGVAVSAISNGILSFLSLRFPDAVASYAAFAAGGFSGIRYSDFLIPFAMICGAILLIFVFGNRLELLLLGDDEASTLGVNVPAARVIGLIGASLLSGAAISFSGLIGFVGLLVPHIIRRRYYGSFRQLLVLTALGGGILTVLADLVGRIAFAPSEIPAGVLTSLLGGFYFLFLLVDRRCDREI